MAKVVGYFRCSVLLHGCGASERVPLPIVTGGGAKGVELPCFQWVNIMISNVKNSMHGTYHAIRQKHLPRHLEEFCFKFNRRFNLENLLEELIYASIRTAPVPQRLLKLAEARW